MLIDIKIPSPGESISEAQLVTWLVQDGDFVTRDQELAEIESDKATLPLIASQDGQIKILIQAGETVKIGAIACTINTEIQPTEKITAPAATVIPEKQKATLDEPVPANQQKTNNHETTSGSLKITPVAHNMMEDNNLKVEEIINGLKRIGKTEVESVLNANK